MQEQKRENGLAWFIGFAVFLVLAGFISGYLWPHHFTNIVQPAIEKIQKIGSSLPKSSPLTSVLTIFINNTIVAIALVLLGVFLGVYPAWVMWMNGVVMGAVSALAVQQTHAGLGKVVLYAILPHGVIEVAALVWAAGLGFNLGFTGARSTLHSLRLAVHPNPESSRGEPLFRTEMKKTGYHVPWIVLLLLVAACIETLVTPHLIQMAAL